MPESIPAGPAKDAAAAYLKLWEAKHPGRDPSAGARAWDSVAVIAKAAELAGSLDGAKMRDALEKVSGLQGAASTYNFSAEEHNGVTQNPFTIGVARDGKLVAK